MAIKDEMKRNRVFLSSISRAISKDIEKRAISVKGKKVYPISKFHTMIISTDASGDRRAFSIVINMDLVSSDVDFYEDKGDVVFGIPLSNIKFRAEMRRDGFAHALLSKDKIDELELDFNAVEKKEIEACTFSVDGYKYYEERAYLPVMALDIEKLVCYINGRRYSNPRGLGQNISVDNMVLLSRIAVNSIYWEGIRHSDLRVNGHKIDWNNNISLIVNMLW